MNANVKFKMTFAKKYKNYVDFHVALLMSLFDSLPPRKKKVVGLIVCTQILFFFRILNHETTKNRVTQCIGIHELAIYSQINQRNIPKHCGKIRC